MKTIFTSFETTTELQRRIIRYIDYWAYTEKVPISKKKIIEEMISRKQKEGTIIHALEGLLRQGYIRKAVRTGSDDVQYVQLRRL